MRYGQTQDNAGIVMTASVCAHRSPPSPHRRRHRARNHPDFRNNFRCQETLGRAPSTGGSHTSPYCSFSDNIVFIDLPVVQERLQLRLVVTGKMIVKRNTKMAVKRKRERGRGDIDRMERILNKARRMRSNECRYANDIY